MFGRSWKIQVGLLSALASWVSASPAQDGKGPLPIASVVDLASYDQLDLSPDGQWLAYEFSSESMGVSLRVKKLDTGLSLAPFGADQEGAEPRILGWSRDGRYLAILNDFKGPALWVWDRATQEAREISGAHFPSAAFARVHWLADNRLIMPLEPESKRPTTDDTKAVPSAESTAALPSVQVLTANFGRKTVAETDNEGSYGACDLAIVTLATNSVRRIATGVRFASFVAGSKDDRTVAYTTFLGRDPATQLKKFDLRLIDLEHGTMRVAATNLHDADVSDFSWSSDGQSIAHLELRAQAVGDGNRDKESAADLAIVHVDGDRPVDVLRQAQPLDGRKAAVWSADGRRIFAAGSQGQLWEIDVQSGRRRIVATFPSDRIDEIVRPEDRRSGLGRTAGNMLIAKTSSRDEGVSNLYEVDPGHSSSTRLARFPRIDQWDVSDAQDTLVFTTSDEGDPGKLRQLFMRKGALRELDTFNHALANVALGSNRRISWRSSRGEELSGTLLLPPGYSPKQRVPLFVWVYGGERSVTRQHIFGLSGQAAFNMQVLASRGYAVLDPDIPQHLGTPFKDIIDAVVPAVDTAIALGFADPERVAVGGHSYGSYTALALITSSHLFKAALLSGVPPPDLTSFYLRMRAGGQSSEYWAETGQGLMGGPPWQYPDRYRDNSPIYQFDKIETPVLMAQGELDSNTQVTGANAVFVGLRRAGVPVEYRIYKGEGHVLHQPGNIIDFWQRCLSFLSERLNVAVDSEGRVIMENDRAKGRDRASD
jgi:dipeptidyl aminopeptidase/acylaminoacyl peptidase